MSVGLTLRSIHNLMAAKCWQATASSFRPLHLMINPCMALLVALSPLYARHTLWAGALVHSTSVRLLTYFTSLCWADNPEESTIGQTVMVGALLLRPTTPVRIIFCFFFAGPSSAKLVRFSAPAAWFSS